MATIPLTVEQISDFTSDGILVLPAGNFSVSTTIDFGTGNVNGIRLQGAGQSYATTETANDYQVTRLYWEGTPGEPMIKGHIRHGVFEDIQLLNGRIHIDPKSGWGTGLCQFNRVSFHGANSGVLFGGAYNGNAADTRFRDCQFNACDACIETTSSQNVNYGVSGCTFYRCDAVFKLNGGGLCNVDNCYLTQVPVIFSVLGDGSETGSQNGNFSVTNLRYDDSQDVKPKIVRDTGSYGDGRILTVINTHESATWGLDIVDSDNAAWTINGLQGSDARTEGNIMGMGSVSGSPYTFTVSLFAQDGGELLTDPTLGRADVRVSTDGGALAQLANTPTVTPADSGIVEVNLTADEVGEGHFTVKFVDAVGNEWEALVYHESVSAASSNGVSLGPVVGTVGDGSGVTGIMGVGESVIGTVKA